MKKNVSGNGIRKEGRLRAAVKNACCCAQGFCRDEAGMGTVEIILIIVVLIALVIIFKNQLTALVNTIFENMVDDANTVLG